MAIGLIEMKPQSSVATAWKPAPRQNLPIGLIQELTENPNRFGLSRVKAIRPASGGLVHHVWVIETDGGRYYAKIRGDTLSGVTEIGCEPRDIEYEAQALRLFKDLAPEHFPEVVHCDANEGLLIMTDAVAEGQSLETLLRKGEVTRQISFRLGKTLRHIHERARAVTTVIRGDREEAFSRLKLEHKLGPARHASTSAAVYRLTHNCQLVLGDPSPKNIAYHQKEDRFTFYDLEDAHLGHSSFDTGFIIGHLLLHNYLDLTSAHLIVDGFCDGYGHRAADDLAEFVAAAIFHYRLNSLIPYCISPSDAHRMFLLRNASMTLDLLGQRSLTWRDVARLLLNLTNTLPEVTHEFV
jgi:hypothetical protein